MPDNSAAAIPAINARLLSALCSALPYIEDAQQDATLKRGVAAKLAREIRAAIAEAESAQPLDRLALIARISNTLFDETESWQDEDHIGAQLAYLCRAIANTSESQKVDWSDPSHAAVFHLFFATFSESDPIWQFITPPVVTDDERSNGPKAY